MRGSPTASNTGSAPAGASAAQQVYDQINGLKGTERTNTLLDLAKKDGTLSLYTSNTDMDDVVKAFEDKYGLKVELTGRTRKPSCSECCRRPAPTTRVPT